MKKLLSIAFAAGSLAALADTTIQGQPIGSTAIISTLTNTIVAVSFKELGPIDQNISVSNIVSTANLEVGDKVYVLVDDSYQSWTLAEGDGYKYWAKNTQVFKLTAQGPQPPTVGASADEIRPTVGTGIWLQRGATWDGSEFTFYVYGAVTNSVQTTVTKGTKALFGNPTSASASPTITGMVKGDHILIPANGVPKRYSYNSKGKWGFTNSSTITVSDTAPAIPAGTGAWYVSTGSSSNVTISWN